MDGCQIPFRALPDVGLYRVMPHAIAVFSEIPHNTPTTTSSGKNELSDSYKSPATNQKHNVSDYSSAVEFRTVAADGLNTVTSAGDAILATHRIETHGALERCCSDAYSPTLFDPAAHLLVGDVLNAGVVGEHCTSADGDGERCCG